MPTHTQEDRLLSIDTPLGKDVLLLTSFIGTEQISGLSTFEIDLLSESESIDPTKIVGSNVTISLGLLDEATRYFNGFVSRFQYLGQDDRLSHYRATVVPWLWFLTRTTDCRIFQTMSVPKIVEQIFNDLGFTDFDDSGITGSHIVRDYCVQYRETDFNFVSRLLEEEGIFYFFKHENGKHTLILGDQNGTFTDCPEKKPEFTEEGGLSHIVTWEHGYEYRSGKYTQTDYNFETPSTKLLTTESTVLKLTDVSKYDLYDYPGGYMKKADGQVSAKARMEEDESAYDIVRGSSRCRTFLPGGKFSLEKHPNAGEVGKEYVFLSVRHDVKLAGGYTTGGGVGTLDYRNAFVCIPSSAIYRPPRVTERAIVQGVQTAVVVGPAGEEIYVDKYGRVKVQFFWDRVGTMNDKSSCWVRVSQAWAGHNWGAVFLPRIGQEVIIDFLEGDPDRPIVTGRVYNAEQMPPYALPGNATQSGIKTRSSKGGGAGNFNEIRFEDKKGGEELLFHAEKNQTVVVENDLSESIGHDETRSVGHDRTETVGNNESVTIGVNRDEKVGSNETLAVGSNRTRTVGSNESVTVGSSRTHSVGVSETITIGAAQTVTVGAMQAITVGADQATTVGASQANTVGAGQTNTIGSDQTNTIGSGQTTTVAADQTNSIGGGQNNSIGAGRTTSVASDDAVTVGKTFTLTVADEITIVTGDAKIIMKKDGTIQIKGKDIVFEASGEISMKADKNIVMKGSKVLLN